MLFSALCICMYIYIYIHIKVIYEGVNYNKINVPRQTIDINFNS
jgi:hypothetical protein